ncbi:MAG: 4-hydroxythreonine-4-phosphate dehydrogenase PdxA [Pseudomonadota bacterium]|jgi:4-hydroxythreonine-4-phosphate dehydrogenase|nr:4-hydroxythreonine-4-phosphate dehydrogenase PdxA [Burkholderiales bacterium]
MQKSLPVVLVTSGEPSGIGPDICLDLANMAPDLKCKIVVVGDKEVLKDRAKILDKQVNLNIIDARMLQDNGFLSSIAQSNTLNIIDVKCEQSVIPGQLNVANAGYVLNILDTAINLCKQKYANIIVTAPVNKAIINQSGLKFSGHTEYFADSFKVKKVVMMLANTKMKVALLTTHIPLKEVSQHITAENLNETLDIILNSEAARGIKEPKIAVCGLNPHAGEDGYLGCEELEIINPQIKKWQTQGHKIFGSFPADTIFLETAKYDLFLAMYHDQGLPVLKYSGFEDGINVTLGLPIIRTSVDHGTALDIAGTGLANSSSLLWAIKFAIMKDFKG